MIFNKFTDQSTISKFFQNRLGYATYNKIEQFFVSNGSFNF